MCNATLAYTLRIFSDAGALSRLQTGARMASSAHFELLRNQVRLACEAWLHSTYCTNRARANGQVAACERATAPWELLTLIAANVAADRAAQEELGRLGPVADGARLRMLVLHRRLLSPDKLLGTLPPAQKQVLDALRSVTEAQIGALRRHAGRVRQALGKEAERNADLEELLA